MEGEEDLFSVEEGRGGPFFSEGGKGKGGDQWEKGRRFICLGGVLLSQEEKRGEFALLSVLEKRKAF